MSQYSESLPSRLTSYLREVVIKPKPWLAVQLAKKLWPEQQPLWKELATESKELWVLHGKGYLIVCIKQTNYGPILWIAESLGVGVYCLASIKALRENARNNGCLDIRFHPLDSRVERLGRRYGATDRESEGESIVLGWNV